jgi:hypothetical protein
LSFALLVLWANTRQVGKPFDPDWPDRVALVLPVHSLTVSSFRAYALMALFILCLVSRRTAENVAAGPEPR